jgi:hypothetical protein
MKPSYVVIGSGSLVEAWSTARLQFEPRDWQRQFRAELRGAASVLVANGQPLLADYRSPVLDSCDAENILFYNVGTRVFVAATAAGLRFERGYVVPPCPVGLASAAQHYHCYELAPSSGAFSLWRNEARLASFGPVRLPPLSAATMPSGIWRGAPAPSCGLVRLLITRPHRDHTGAAFDDLDGACEPLG